MNYCYGLAVNEDANAIGCKSGESGRFGYKLDARRASGAVALRQKKRNATGSHEHQQLLWHDFRSIAAEIAHRRVSGSAERARSAADATAVETAATAV